MRRPSPRNPALVSRRSRRGAVHLVRTRSVGDASPAEHAASRARLRVTFGEWDWTAQPGQPFYVTYDDAESLAAKVAWAQQLGLGGIMIYNLESGWLPTATPPDPLLRAVVDAM
jgi:hypothetical protein